ncbi:lipopolysaccharide biosynthesis protein [Paenibacillus elgii]
MSLFKSTLWSSVNTLGVNLIGLLTNVVLARMLYPELFGMLGMATVFTGLVVLLQEVGFSSYLVYKQDIERKEISTSFWLNFAISAALAALLWVASGSIATFYGVDDVQSVVRYIALGLLFGSFGVIGRAIYTKRMQFNVLAAIDLSAELVTSAVAIILAAQGFPLLAITSRLLIRPALQAVILSGTTWKETAGSFDWNVVKEMVPYSTRIMAASFFGYFNNIINYLLIGKLLGSRSLGMYTVAWQWGMFTRFYISGPVGKVGFSAVSSHQNDMEKVRHIFVSMLTRISFISFPFCMGLIIVAPEFVDVVYGKAWTEVIPVLQLLLAAGMISTLGSPGGSVLRGIGKPQEEMKYILYSSAVLLMLLLIFSKYGLVTVAVALLFHTLVFETIKILIINRLILLSTKLLLKRLLRSFNAAFLMAVVVSAVKWALPGMPSLPKLIIMVAVAIVTYALVSYFFNRTEIEWGSRKLMQALNRTMRRKVKSTRA